MHSVFTCGIGALLLFSYRRPEVGARALSARPATKLSNAAGLSESEFKITLRGEPSDKRRKGNEGDAHAVDDRDIAGLDAGELPPTKTTEFSGINPSGSSPVDTESDDDEPIHTQDELNRAWKAALDQGSLIKTWLDKYVTARKSRLDDLGGPRPDTARKFEAFYVDAPEKNAPLKDTWGDVDRPFALSGTSVTDDGHWTDHLITSKGGDPDKPVTQMGSSVPQHALITFTMEGDDDTNEPRNQLRSSEIQYQAWCKAADALPNRPNSRRGLKYWMQSSIVNDDTLAIMYEAHERFPDHIDHSHDSDPDVVGSTHMRRGHGIWRPPATNDPNDELGEVWIRLLATPNLRVIVHALADHADELENPYPVEIHTLTFEQIIIVVLGQKDPIAHALNTNLAVE